MGCILDKIDDHYDDYVKLCKELDKAPLNITDDFYTDWKNILDLKESFFIKGNVPSLKNSKRWTGKYLISSARVLEYEKNTKHQYETVAPHIMGCFLSKVKPYRISFKFVRGSKHKFDYINAVQLPLDLFVKYGILEDDNADEVIPVFEPYEYNKDNPGVWIKII